MQVINDLQLSPSVGENGHTLTQNRQIPDPTCTFPACKTSAPFFLDTIEHILLSCPRHQVARQHLQAGVALHHPNPPPLTLAFISGEVSEPRKLSPPQHKLAIALLQLTAAFLDQVSTDRQTDPALRTRISTSRPRESQTETRSAV